MVDINWGAINADSVVLVSVCVVGSWGSLGWLAGAWNPSLSYIVIDQNASAGGSWLWLLGRPPSESGLFCHGDGGHGQGDRRRAFMSATLSR